MSPGITYFPRPSMRVAPLGIATSAAEPNAVMRPLVRSTTASAIGGRPVPSIAVAPVMAMTCEAAGVATARKRAAKAVVRRVQMAGMEGAGGSGSRARREPTSLRCSAGVGLSRRARGRSRTRVVSLARTLEPGASEVRRWSRMLSRLRRRATDSTTRRELSMTDHAVFIRTRRAESNQAIAARDADRVVAVMHPDVSVSVAGGPVLNGRESNRAAFAEQFADRAFRGYVREAEEIVVHDPPSEATERGRWTGRWQHGIGTETMRGSYVARWRLEALGWFIVSEVFVPG